MGIGDFVTLTQLAIHVATVVLICRYREPGARYRPVISFIAAAVAGLSLASASWLLLTWPESHRWVVLTLSSICLASLVRSRGNIAKALRWKR